MNIIDKLFNRIEDDIRLKLSCYKNLIAEGKIYLAEEKFCESKKHLFEIIDDREQWENEVNLFLRRIRKEKFRPRDVLELQDKLREIFEIGMEKVNRKDKSEIMSVSIGGENVKLNDVLNRINNFEKNTDECFVFTIERYLRDIEDDVGKMNRTFDVWTDMYESLIDEEFSIIEMKDNIVRIRDDFLNNRR